MPKKRKSPPAFDERYTRLMKRIASNIRRIREESGYTQEAMLELGFERRWLQRIESGTYSVSLPTLEKLAFKLKVDVSEFFKAQSKSY